MTNIWCRHITWLPKLGGGKYWKSHWFLNSSDLVPRSWKVCPICQTDRPTKANTASEVNRALQDGGDEE